jgi:hypothetical protein
MAQKWELSYTARVVLLAVPKVVRSAALMVARWVLPRADVKALLRVDL